MQQIDPRLAHPLWSLTGVRLEGTGSHAVLGIARLYVVGLPSDRAPQLAGAPGHSPSKTTSRPPMFQRETT
jgi:hypothetical protein